MVFCFQVYGQIAHNQVYYERGKTSITRSEGVDEKVMNEEATGDTKANTKLPPSRHE